MIETDTDATWSCNSLCLYSVDSTEMGTSDICIETYGPGGCGSLTGPWDMLVISKA